MTAGSFLTTAQRWVVVLAVTLIGSTAGADEMKYITRGEDFLSLIEGRAARAKSTLDLTYFIYEPCHAGTRLFSETLKRKAKEGVRVRVLLDAFMHTPEIHRLIAQDLMSAGVQFRSYNDALKVSPGRNHRSHLKLLLVDDKEYITGGRNVGDDYFSLYKKVNFIDRDIWVRGTSAQQAKQAFDVVWKSRMSSSVKLQSSAQSVNWSAVCAQQQGQASAAEQQKRFQDVKKRIQAKREASFESLPTRHCHKVSFWSDDPDFLNGRWNSDRDRQEEEYLNEMRLKKKASTREFLNFIVATKNKLEIENWSYIPSGRVNESFRRLRSQKKSIMVVTNSGAEAGGVIDRGFDHVMKTLSARDNKGTQIVLQVPRSSKLQDRHALTPKSATFKLHGKVAVRDNKDVLIGTYNIDPRSYHTNLESVLIVEDCPELAQDVRKPIVDLVRLATSEDNVEAGSSAGLKDRLLGWLAFEFL